jgi:transposase
MSPELLNAQEILDAEANKEFDSKYEKLHATQKLRRELQESVAPDIKIRRALIALSLIGIGAMTAVSLFQTNSRQAST